MSQETMEKYIQRTKLPNAMRYAMVLQEFEIIYNLIKCGKISEGLNLVYMYGMAKGYRMAKKEAVR